MIKVNIHGSCVSRDIFRFDSNEQFKVMNYIGRNSIVSLSYPPVDLCDFRTVADSYKLAWEQRMIYYDCKKIVMDKIVSDCDYLIIDLIDERFGILESDLGLLTYSQVLQRSEYIKELVPYRIRDVKPDTDEFYNAYKNYALYLKKHFDVHKIIIHEAYPVSIYLGADNKLYLFDSNEINKNKKICSKLKKGYELLETFLPESHILRMPHDTMAFEKHMWGKAAVHYVDDYYIEMLSQINGIIEKDINTENTDIVCVKGIYSPCIINKNSQNIKIDKSIINQKTICFDNIEYQNLNEQHRFYTEKYGYHFEFFLYKKDSPKLYVVLGGARTSNGKKRDIPYFNRWSYYEFLDGSLLVVEDPMFYKYSELLLGWFYGTQNENGCREGLIELIRQITNMLHVSNENLYFYSSSGGGTVAIYLASLLKKSTAITINPQIDLASWNYSKSFCRITGINLYEKDKFSRNDIVSQIKNCKESNFVILVNMESENDKKQLEYFSNKYNCSPSLGLNQYENLIIWEYRAKVQMPHTAFETKELFWPIIYLGDILKKGESIHSYDEIYAMIGDLWSNILVLQDDLKQNSKNNNYPVLIMSQVQEAFIKNKYQQGVRFKSVDNNFQYVKVLEKINNGVLYHISIRITDNFIPYDLVIYDFLKKRIISKKFVDIPFVNLIILANYEEYKDCSLLLYNGTIGDTSNNCMLIDSIQISVIATDSI